MNNDALSRQITTYHFRSGKMDNTEIGWAKRMTSIATAFSGGATASLIAVVLVPTAPGLVIVGIGLAGLLVSKYVAAAIDDLVKKRSSASERPTMGTPEAASETAVPNGPALELLSRYEKACEGAVKEFGLLRSDDLARAVHSTGENVSLIASKWRRKGDIFAVSYIGEPGYFAFQFDLMSVRPRPAIAKIIQAFPPNTDGWQLALWLVAANPRLANRRPVDVLGRNPEQVIEAAKGENRVELF